VCTKVVFKLGNLFLEINIFYWNQTMMKILRIVFKLIKILILLIIGFVMINHLVNVSKQTIEIERLEIQELLKKENSIICVLEANKIKHRIGETPDINVKIINKLDSTILLVGSLDGSDLGVRPPISQFEISHKFIGKKQFYSNSRYCAFLNPLRKEDFVYVEPNETFNPYMKIDELGYFSSQNTQGMYFLIPGIYEFTYYYYSKKVGTILLDQNFDISSETESKILWEQVPNLELSSNTISIEYNIF